MLDYFHDLAHGVVPVTFAELSAVSASKTNQQALEQFQFFHRKLSQIPCPVHGHFFSVTAEAEANSRAALVSQVPMQSMQR